MSYVVKSSEKLRPTASDSETKALLYLMNFRDDSDEIYYFVVDFFNDLTGMSRLADKMWDVQSKGAKCSSPKAVGKELVTLFKNYISDFKFDYYILFLGGISSSARKNSTLTHFDIGNIEKNALKSIKEGLIEECKNKTYIDNNDITDENISKFLRKVLFVIDDKNKSEYVKKIIKLNPAIIPKEETLVAIFNEIRDVQSSKKNIGVIEGKIIKTPDEAIMFGRHLSITEIKLLVLNRILTEKVVGAELPPSFSEIYNKYPEEKRRSLLEDCQLDFSKALFDTTSQDDYWKLFEEVYRIAVNNPKYNVNEIFNNLDNELKKKCQHFNVLSLKYFIAKIKDGIKI